MYSGKKNRWMKHLDFMLIDIVSICVALFLAYGFRHGFHSVYARDEYRNIGLVMIALDLGLVFFRDSYKDVIRRGYLRELEAAVAHFSLVIVGTLLYLYVVKQSELFSRLTLGWTWLIGCFLMYLLRIALKTWLRRRILQREKLVSVLLVLSHDTAEETIRRLQETKYRDFDITGAILLGAPGQEARPAGPRAIRKVPVVADAEHFAEYIKSHVVDELFVNVSGLYPQAETIMQECVQMGITVHQNLQGIMNGAGSKVVDDFAGYMVLTSSLKVASYSDLFLKRCMDIAGAVVGLVVTAFLYPFVAVAIKRKSPGPVLFAQERVGRNGRRIRIHKFRSMRSDAEAQKSALLEHNQMQGQMFKIKDDPRIIPGIGEFIRRTSIDEFPQFWNVLKGEMSLVGTRPPTVEEYEHYDMHHLVRMSIKPGLTGLWQVSGRNEITDFEEVVRLDTKYIEEWSLNLDIKILMKTIRVMAQGSGE